MPQAHPFLMQAPTSTRGWRRRHGSEPDRFPKGTVSWQNRVWPCSCNHFRQMLPTSHPGPTLSTAPAGGVLPIAAQQTVAGLAHSFSEFMKASAVLERSYRDLQAEVRNLNRELSERNQALEASLEENRQMHQALNEAVDAMPCGVLLLDDTGSLLRMNKEAALLLGLSEQEAAVPSLAALAAIGKADLRRFAEQESRSELVIGAQGDSVEHEAASPVNCWVEVQSRHLLAVGHGRRTLLTLRDIRSQKQAEQQREAGRRALALAEVAAVMAHEIRNPLAGLALFVELLTQEPDRAAEWVAHLHAGLRTLSASVNNVLALYGEGLGSGTVLPAVQAMPIAQAVSAAVDFIRPIVAQAGLAIFVEGLDVCVDALVDAPAIQQVLLNLVTNAVRHTPAGGTVHIRSSVSGKTRELSQATVALAVTDSGCGIDPEHLPHVFEAGWSARGQSSGLGLAVCQRIAAQHGGRMSVQSELGNGSTFLLELPC